MDIESLEKKEVRKKSLMVGLLFALASLVALIFAYWMGAFGVGPSRVIYVGYNFAGGLDSGSTVRLAGVKVGRVAGLEFRGSDAPTSIRLKLEVSGEAFKRVTDDTKYFINLAGLIGERYVEIVPGTGSPIQSKQEFRGEDPPRVDQLLSQGFGMFGDLRALLSENKGDIRDIINSLNDLAKSTNTLVGSLSNDKRVKLGELIGNLSQASTDLRLLVADLREGSSFVRMNGGAETWANFRELASKANRIEREDLQRLMLEDGVRVNFSGRKFPPLEEAQEKQKP